MTCKMAVWLDHRRAFVVTACDREITTHTVEFEETPMSRPGGGVRTSARGGQHGVDPDQRRDAHHALHLGRYYDRIIELLDRADRIHILGPGQAKLELKQRILAHKPLASVPLTLEAVDRRTDAQIVAHVRHIFGVPLARAARG